MIINNERIRPFILDTYSLHDIQKLVGFLQQEGTFDFPVLKTGLFPAAHLSARGQYTGYDNVWVRDNIHIANAHYVIGQSKIAVKNVETLLFYFGKYCHRWEKIIFGEVDPTVAMNRPHIRFNGNTLEELNEPWAHAQNDALGYFLWLYCKLGLADLVTIKPEDWKTLALFPLFFQSIHYWEDADSGHWEEARKIEASSIGVVVAALQMMRQVMIEKGSSSLVTNYKVVTIDFLNDLIKKGRNALDKILPAESIQSGHERLYDSALLFLIYPLGVVNADQEEAILKAVETHLKGDYGIRRYLGDSFWCANYDELISQEHRTGDFSENIEIRDALVNAGEEAHWCVFDPIISIIYGLRYEKTQNKKYAIQQIYYLHRSLGQLTSSNTGFRQFLCPELYYLKGDHYIPNDVTPLLWTQANLRLALKQMEKTATR